jgi:hypothetical protein
MKNPKILDAVGKKESKYLKQTKRWFKMNPNRYIVNIKISNIDTILIKREDVI